ncbi:CotO family spore coat protein [Bacillus suaedaesalsae]|uniref:Spore coat protein CotO n=1 Tax=Bacillus suaedaesalsae TaxID=2810349 RepID=A0ABS2DIF3_9BACI|nr:CotO family spore coat protein [Bacillus suaedaesalsae]MBM6618248.1 hypothetical protein [Bacillus suaedaesalsae]
MINKETVKQRPLMYISQPNFSAITAKMQHVVTKKKVFTEVKEEPKAEVEVSQNEIPTVEEEEVPQKVVDTPKNRKSRRRRFVELNIEEKIKFFVKLPANVPKSTCQIKTESETYRGKVIGFNEGIVLINTVSEPYEVQLSLQEIKDISIIGL